MVDTYNKVLCSWCNYNIFIPISSRMVKCYNCENLKCLDEMQIVPPTEYPETTED